VSEVAERLRKEIQHGRIPPGARLRQNELAARFGVSTTPLREAFAQLQAEGLIRIAPHRGAVVFHPSPEDLTEIYEIRKALEALAVGRAVPLSPKELNDLQDRLDVMRTTKNRRRWVELNDAFHMSLYRASDRSRLTAMIENLRDASSAYVFMYISSQPDTRDADAEHDKILAACRAGDAKLAADLTRRHLESTEAGVMSFLASLEPETSG
jgi:DNA-binding GntR family transcriptional regulator